MLVGVVSDTHGLLRPRVPELLDGCDAILHAGDVGDPDILDRLAAVAPLTVVRGNVDSSGRLAALPDRVSGTLTEAAAKGAGAAGGGASGGPIGGPISGAVRYRMVHRQDDIGGDWFEDTGLVVFGHSHQPHVSWHGSCLLLNPGACGPRRFRLPLTLARLHVSDDGRLTPELLAVE